LDANAQRPGGPYPFFTCGEETLEIDHYAFDTEAVLLAGNGNFNAKWYRGKFNAYQRTYVIEPVGVHGKWLFYAVQAALRRITSGNRGSVIRFIRLGDIVDSTVSVPSVDEQRRIVAEIEKQFTRLEAGVAALRRVQANLHRYRAAVLKAACEGRLVPTETGKWRKVSLAQLGKWCGGGTPSKSNPKFWTNGKIPWVSPKDMKVPVIVDAEDHITKEAVENSATNLLPKGSVLVVTRSGILQHTLPVAVCAREVAINQDLKALQPSADFSSRYVAVALKGHEQEILQTCTKTGTTVQNIEFPVFMRFEIDAPPVAEQERIVAEVERRLSVVEELSALVESNLKRATRLRQAVLQRAFTGEL